MFVASWYVGCSYRVGDEHGRYCPNVCLTADKAHAWFAQMLADGELHALVSQAINPVATHPLDRSWADEEATAAISAIRAYLGDA